MRYPFILGVVGMVLVILSIISCTAEKKDFDQSGAVPNIPVTKPQKVSAVTPGAETIAIPRDSLLPQHAKWRMTFRDEFNGDRLNPEVWEAPEGYRPLKNNVVKHGILHQVTYYHKAANAKYKWTMAHIRTRSFTQQYGYFEARMKYAPYHNNAFWLWRPSSVFKAQPHFEIDINEGHIPDEVRMTLHFFTYPDGPNTPGELNSSGMNVKTGGELDKEWHVYGCEWNEKEIVFYFDGRPLRRITNPICHAPADVRFSTKLDLGEIRRLGKKAEDVADGVSMDVDWVRIWRKTRDLNKPEYPMPAFKVKAIQMEKSEPRVKIPASKPVTTFKDDFEKVQAGPCSGWHIGNGKPQIIARDGGNRLMLPVDAYVFKMLPQISRGVFAVEFDLSQEERRGGLLFVSLGKFNLNDQELVRESYYKGDIGIYAWWSKYYIRYYTKIDKFLPIYRRKNDGRWHRYRFILDVKNHVFDVYGGKGLKEFLCSGRFRGNQQAAFGIGFRNRQGKAPIFIDNVTVRQWLKQ